MTLEKDIDEFCELLKKHTMRKADLYDGAGDAKVDNRDVWYALALLTEETGEVASALIRERAELARVETIDSAHCAFLIWRHLGK